MTRRARFKVAERCDGSASCTVIVEMQGVSPLGQTLTGRSFISVRPKGRRRIYTLPLATVAEMIVARVVKAEMPAGTVPMPRRRTRG